MYKILSRNKTDGSYTICAKFDPEFTAYGNTIENIEFNDIELAISWILLNGNKLKVYYICSEYNHDTDNQHINNQMINAGNNHFIRHKYCYTNKEWIRMALCSPKPHCETKSGYKYYKKYPY